MLKNKFNKQILPGSPIRAGWAKALLRGEIFNWSILFILILAAFLRFYQLADYPALNPDEAALGYNAYSLLETGKDEHGASWPLHFKSFGDYKPGGYVYLALPFVKILGLTPLAVRLPNLIFSLLSIYYIYRLILLGTKNTRLATISALLLAISPWHIHFSRGAWESQTALSLTIIATYYFLFSLQTKKTNLSKFTLSLVLFAFSLYFYHSARIYAPLLGITLVLFNFKKLWPQRQKLTKPLILAFLICLPVTISFLKTGGSVRFSGVGITADQGPLWRTNELINHHQGNILLVRLHHNKFISYTLSWAQKYLSHFEGNFLFVNGDEVPRSKVPEMGQMYSFEVVLLLLGLALAFFTKKKKPFDYFMLVWLFIAPLASSLTFQTPSALRSLPLVVPLLYFTAQGLKFLLGSPIRAGWANAPLRAGIFLLYIFTFIYYLDAYFVHWQKRYPYANNYGFKNLVAYTESVKEDYHQIYITNRYDQPHILFLFFSKYPPAKFQQEVRLTPPDQFGFQTVTHFDKYRFEETDPSGQYPPNSLIIDENNPFFKPK
jgi:4-amino-4-deoxy-L-arabinose transferase-like glycosyltransferase